MKDSERIMVLIDTRDYELSYGHKPRGSWAFMFDKQSYDSVDEVWWTPGSTLYSEAKKLAIAEAKNRKASVIYVQT